MCTAYIIWLYDICFIFLHSFPLSQVDETTGHAAPIVPADFCSEPEIKARSDQRPSRSYGSADYICLFNVYIYIYTY